MNTLDVTCRVNTLEAFQQAYVAHMHELLTRLDECQMQSAHDMLRNAYDQDRSVFIIGNGGSAATASHFAVDLGKGANVAGKRSFRVSSLTDNVPYLTAVGNDLGYASVFKAQLENLLRPEDLLIGITASGNSPNIIDAFEYARTNNARTLGLVGFNGGKLKDMCDSYVLIPTMHGDYGQVEDMHGIVQHILSNYFARSLRSQ